MKVRVTTKDFQTAIVEAKHIRMTDKFVRVKTAEGAEIDYAVDGIAYLEAI